MTKPHGRTTCDRRCQPAHVLARAMAAPRDRDPPLAPDRVLARLDAGSRRAGAADLRHSYRETEECVRGHPELLGPHSGMLAGFAIFLGRQFLFALPMLFVVTVADNATTHSRRRVRVIALSAAVLLGAIVYGLAFFFTQPPSVVETAAGRYGVWILAHCSRGALYGGLATAVLYLFAREREDAQALHAARLEKVWLDRQTTEAHLQALQAQIEPHFLFNTLANIKLLYETESSRAKPLIHDLAAYLRTALPQMRDMRSTLARELELAQAYLRVLKVRMGERLNVVIDVPADLREATLPPMMLLTLVENAIKHGLGSLPRGGTITIRAEYLAERFHVSVIDDGIGFPKGFGAGVGLANTRARLAALYGDQGHLTLVANPRGGVIAEIVLPCENSITAQAAA
jgi:signal transduction histidine kinase